MKAKSVLQADRELIHVTSEVDALLEKLLGERHGFLLVYIPDGDVHVSYSTNLSAKDARTLAVEVAERIQKVGMTGPTVSLRTDA